MLEYLMLAWIVPTAIVSFGVYFNIIFYAGSLIHKYTYIIISTWYIYLILIILFLVIDCNIIEHLTK